MWPALSDEATVLGDETWTFADLLLLGIATGLVEEAESSTRRGLRALQQAEPGLSQDDLRSEAVAFRRARRLESGQDLRVWLAARELTIDDWEAHLRRSSASREVRVTSGTAEGPGSEIDCRALAVDLACGGWWRRFADLAARQWSAARLVGEEFEVADSEVSVEAARIMAEFEPLAALGESRCIDRLRSIKAREHALEEAARRCATAKAVEDRVLGHAGEWTELRFDELVLPSREAANEALLCAREDGIGAADLAARARLPLLQHSARRDSLPLASATLLDGALADQPFGPVAHEGQWAVLWLRERRRPSLDDEALRATAAAELLDEALERVGQGQIRQAEAL